MRRKVYDAVLLQVCTRCRRFICYEVESFKTIVPGNEPHYLLRFLSTKTQSGKTIKTRLLGGSFDIARLLQLGIFYRPVLTYRTDPWVCLLYTSPSPRDRQKSR